MTAVSDQVPPTCEDVQRIARELAKVAGDVDKAAWRLDALLSELSRAATVTARSDAHE